MDLLGTLEKLWTDSGFYLVAADWRQIIMILVGCLLLYLGIVKSLSRCSWWASPSARC